MLPWIEQEHRQPVRGATNPTGGGRLEGRNEKSMAADTYEDVLRAAHHLTPEEQRRLREELDAVERHQAHAARVHTTMANLRELAQEIGAAWTTDLDAVEAVREQRRDL